MLLEDIFFFLIKDAYMERFPAKVSGTPRTVSQIQDMSRLNINKNYLICPFLVIIFEHYASQIPVSRT